MYFFRPDRREVPIANLLVLFRPERQRGAYCRGSGGVFRPERQRGAYCRGSGGVFFFFFLYEVALKLALQFSLKVVDTQKG